jgi:hypothetical protein
MIKTYRRWPRKLKKQQSKISLDFTIEDWLKLKALAKAMGMRPTQYIHHALLYAIEREDNNGQKT